MLTAKQISKRLLDRRYKLGFTQEALAAIAKVSTETIRRLERGAAYPNLLTLCKVAEALETTPATLLAEKVSQEAAELVGGLPDKEREIACVILRAMADHAVAHC